MKEWRDTASAKDIEQNFQPYLDSTAWRRLAEGQSDCQYRGEEDLSERHWSRGMITTLQPFLEGAPKRENDLDSETESLFDIRCQKSH